MATVADSNFADEHTDRRGNVYARSSGKNSGLGNSRNLEFNQELKTTINVAKLAICSDNVKYIKLILNSSNLLRLASRVFGWIQ